MEAGKGFQLLSNTFSLSLYNMKLYNLIKICLMSKSQVNQIEKVVLSAFYTNKCQQFQKIFKQVSSICSIKFNKAFCIFSEIMVNNQMEMEKQFKKSNSMTIRPPLKLQKIISTLSQQIKRNSYIMKKQNFTIVSKRKVNYILTFLSYVCFLLAFKILYLSIKKQVQSSEQQGKIIKAFCNIGIILMITILSSTSLNLLLQKNGFKYGLLLGSILGQIIRNLSNKGRWFEGIED